MGVRRRLVALLWRRGTMDEVGDATIWINICLFFFETADGGPEVMEDPANGGSEVLEDPADGRGSLDFRYQM
jgi:hypothetical protein